ncbi:MAG TPA: hypothetical protein PLL33_15805, partial [Paracoccus sp. (in: a-proteobacteria)]|nr:hypothetical protein [Paracoccus sp. (in: a-proteobacteria)]
EAEHRLYPAVLRRLAEGACDGTRPMPRGHPPERTERRHAGCETCPQLAAAVLARLPELLPGTGGNRGKAGCRLTAVRAGWMPFAWA